METLRYFFLFTLCTILSLRSMDMAAASDGNGYRHIENISYVSVEGADAYMAERCRLDIYYPENVDNFATLVWFHGGGLEGGSKSLLDEFRERGFAVVDVNYRLSPKVTAPAYINDAAMAVAWVFEHIEEYGGTPDQIYIGGHSAGGYLTLMLALDKSYLDSFGADADKIVKAYPVSGQTTTHYAIRAERGISRDLPVIDSLAPSNNARKEGAPIMMITGDAGLEMTARYEENAHLHALLRHFGHPSQLYCLEGCDHGSVLAPACCMIRRDIMKLWKEYISGH